MDGLSRVWDERKNAYVCGADGEVLTFPTAYDAEQWIADLAIQELLEGR